MKDTVLAKCDLLSRNREVVDKVFKDDMDYTVWAGASILTKANVEGTPDKLKELKAYVKANTKFASDFRGYNGPLIVCKMATKSNPEAYFDRVNEIFQYMQGKKLMGSEDRIIAASVVADYVGDGDYTELVSRTTDIHKKMASKHVWLTDSADIPYAAVLAYSNRDVDQLIDDMERCYAGLKRKFGAGNPLQSLSHILALQPEPADYKCAKVISLFDDLKSVKHSIGTSKELPTLGALCVLNMTNQSIIDIITEADDQLMKDKAWGKFAMMDKTRIMYISHILLNEYVSSASADDAILANTLTALTTAIEVYMVNAAIDTAAATTAIILS